ncbi:hypothetical protein E4U54_008119 [Claviceps lovelessii]|nr:hypothetical protein E4U54_008119 [Claviceps lovelessii]
MVVALGLPTGVTGPGPDKRHKKTRPHRGAGRIGCLVSRRVRLAELPTLQSGYGLALGTINDMTAATRRLDLPVPVASLATGHHPATPATTKVTSADRQNIEAIRAFETKRAPPDEKPPLSTSVHTKHQAQTPDTRHQTPGTRHQTPASAMQATSKPSMNGATIQQRPKSHCGTRRLDQDWGEAVGNRTWSKTTRARPD